MNAAEMAQSGPSTRTYHSPLRHAQTEATRTRILDAVAKLIEQGGDPTFGAIAESAGVQERTVYRHFGTKEDLYRAFWDHVHQERIETSFTARDLSSLRELVATSFAGFDRNPALVKAMLHSDEGLEMRLSANAERREMFEAVVRRELSGRSPVVRRRAAAAAQVLYSAMAWEYLREYWDMDGDEATATVQQALTALMTALAASPPATRRRS